VELLKEIIETRFTVAKQNLREQSKDLHLKCTSGSKGIESLGMEALAM